MAANEDQLNLENFRVLLDEAFGETLEEYYEREFYPETGARLKEKHLSEWLGLFQQRFSTVEEAATVLESVRKAEELLRTSIQERFGGDKSKQAVVNVVISPPQVVKVCLVLADDYYQTADGVATRSFVRTIRDVLARDA